jgi:hypothetical protein
MSDRKTSCAGQTLRVAGRRNRRGGEKGKCSCRFWKPSSHRQMRRWPADAGRAERGWQLRTLVDRVVGIPNNDSERARSEIRACKGIPSKQPLSWQGETKQQPGPRSFDPKLCFVAKIGISFVITKVSESVTCLMFPLFKIVILVFYLTMRLVSKT